MFNYTIMDADVMEWYDSEEFDAVAEEFENTMTELAAANGVGYYGDYSTQCGNGQCDWYIGANVTADGDNIYEDEGVTHMTYDHATHVAELMRDGGKAVAKRMFDKLMELSV